MYLVSMETLVALHGMAVRLNKLSTLVYFLLRAVLSQGKSHPILARGRVAQESALGTESWAARKKRKD